MEIWKLSDSGNHCPSCEAAAGQVHPHDAWYDAGIFPKSEKLYCSHSCHCVLELTDLPESGDLAAIPLRQDDQLSTHLQLSNTPTRNGFEIFAITQGNGNGWNFPADVLRKSLSLWANASCFIDHDFFSRSIKDLAGVCTNPQWDETGQGIKMELKPFGPGADTLIQIGKEMLSNNTPAKVGFSADILFTATGKTVTNIHKVNSVDLVYQPARGGAFLRALNSKNGVPMTEENLNPPAVEPNPADDLVKAQRLQLCAYVLDSGLSASKLPEPMQKRVRDQFTGREFTPDELNKSIEDARTLVSDLTGSAAVHGPRISGMVTSEDQITAATFDMFGASRDEGQEKIIPARLSGIRELYHLLTGDYEMHGSYHPDQMQLSTTLDFTGLVKNALNKVVVNQWEALGRAGYDWWTRIVRTEHFNSLNDITGTLVGTVGELPTVVEGAEYTELVIGDSPETASFVKRGGYIPLTLELIDRDETRKLASYPRELANAGLRTISALVAAIFTSNSAVGPTMADTGALFNATAVTTKGGHKNLLTAALAADKWDAACQAVYDQPLLIKNDTGKYGTGPKMAINPKYCLVPRALQLTAMKILYPSLENAATIYSENMQRGQPGDVITVPEWTDATDWAAVCDPTIAPAIYLGERFGLLPEIYIAGNELSPAVFTNDEHRLKVRHFLAIWVNDYRPLHKSNVAG